MVVNAYFGPLRQPTSIFEPYTTPKNHHLATLVKICNYDCVMRRCSCQYLHVYFVEGKVRFTLPCITIELKVLPGLGS